MKCPLCGGVGAISHREFPERVGPSRQKTSRDQQVVLQGIHLMTSECPEINGIHAEDLSAFCDGLGEAHINAKTAHEILVELTGMELIQLCGWGETQTCEWLPTVVCTEEGQLLAEQLVGDHE